MIDLTQLDEEIRIALALAERLGLSAAGDQVTVHWENQGIEPTVDQLAIVEQVMDNYAPDPDWLDPLSPDYDWLVWKRETENTPPPYKLPDLWDIVMRMLKRM